MQGNEIDIGGFKGRTNKLVDGCYSWWCDRSFSLLEALGVHANAGLTHDHHKDASIPTAFDISDDLWDDMDGTIPSCLMTKTDQILSHVFGNRFFV